MNEDALGKNGPNQFLQLFLAKYGYTELQKCILTSCISGFVSTLSWKTSKIQVEDMTFLTSSRMIINLTLSIQFNNWFFTLQKLKNEHNS